MSARRSSRAVSRRRQGLLARADSDPSVMAARAGFDAAERRVIECLSAAAAAVRAGIGVDSAERELAIAREARVIAEARLEQARQIAADALECAA